MFQHHALSSYALTCALLMLWTSGRIVKEWCGDADPADEEEEQEEGAPALRAV